MPEGGGRTCKDSVASLSADSTWARRQEVSSGRWSSPPSDSRVSTLGARVSNWRASAIGTNSRVLPLCAIRAGMTSCNWVAADFRKAPATHVVSNGKGGSRSAPDWRNLVEGLPARRRRIDMGRDLDDTRAGELPVGARAAPSQGEQHCMSGHGRVSDEGGFLAGVEEAQANVMVRAVRREHERDLRVGKLARHGEQGGVVLSVRVEDDSGWVTGESCGRKGIDLENTQGCLRSLSDEFCTHYAPRATTVNRVNPTRQNAGAGSR